MQKHTHEQGYENYNYSTDLLVHLRKRQRHDAATCKNYSKTHSKAKRQMLPILDRTLIITPHICLHESLQTFSAEIE